MNKILSIVMLLFLPGFLFAQITVETVTTDTIDLFSSVQEQAANQKSSGAAMALSLLVPGLGHQYTERPNAALAYLTVDIMSLIGVFFGERYSKQLVSDSRGYAAVNAGTQGNNDSERYWQMVGAYNRMEDYNNDVRLARDLDKLYNEEKYQWYWNSDEAKEKFNHMRDVSRKMHIVSSFCLAAMVLNRVVAFVDVRAATRYRGTRIQTSFSLQPSFDKPRLTVLAEF